MEDVSLIVAIVGFILVILKFCGTILKLIGSIMLVVGLALYGYSWAMAFIVGGAATGVGAYITNKITGEEILDNPVALIIGVVEVIIGIIIIAIAGVD